MTFEEYLSTQAPPTKEDIRKLNTKYLGSYLYGILKPEAKEWPQTRFTPEKSKSLSERQFRECVDVLYDHEIIDEAEMLLLLDLIDLPLVPQSKEETIEKVREILNKE